MPSPTVKVPIAAPLDVIILAAGQGTRMKSGLAKVLHKLDGRPLVAHVCRTAAKLNPRKIYVVVGHQADRVEAAVLDELGKNDPVFVRQEKQQIGRASCRERGERPVVDETTKEDKHRK